MTNDISSIIVMLGLEKVDKWEEVYGYYGYKDRMYFNGIGIQYNPRSSYMGIMVEMSGQGCRTFETYGNGNYEGIFREIVFNDKEMHITRLDIAYDDHDGTFKIERLIKDSRKGNYTSRFKDCEIIESLKNRDISINHGSKQSNIYIRIYDKAKERGFDDGRHWIRFEIMLRDENALGFIKHKSDIGVKFLGIVNNYLRYLAENKKDPEHKHRWETASYWKKFIGSVEKLRIYEKPGEEYNMINLHNYVINQAGNSINTYRQIVGDETFLEVLDVQRKKAVLSEKQKRLLSEHEQNPVTIESEKEKIKTLYAEIQKRVPQRIKCTICKKTKDSNEFVSYQNGVGECRSCYIKKG